ncbi:hypothetical protein P691DRAFT_802037 [Macrolepiota fuliginosa MF-IS2]|uniref:IgA peptidase M64 n=1 Tax=Macrolepiota fuliginosa MF-IS2 TaxID=1400762 RepID=A0A9P6C9I9_9AGAR|nr:hypothetical protein P691DRAFT_802037 [Macrolepiota fuliginosa MF-IS2]
MLNHITTFLLLAFGTSASLGNAWIDETGIAVQQPMAMPAVKGKHLGKGTCIMHGPLNALGRHRDAKDPSHSISVPSPPLDIRPLVVSGPPENRIDLVFFSDGYTSRESDKFFADAKQLADDVSQNQTFYTVKPLINFWGAFTPSEESGIGVGGVPKNTPFGLYRDGTELRAVYYDKPEVAHAACDSMQDQCDYPILLGNDPLYGGLGGEFTVITSSLLNGPLVLRHELGHSVIDVGEEYDGGFAYFGVNAAQNNSEPVPWAHWLSPSDTAHDDLRSTSTSMSAHSGARVERSVMPIQVYPWTLLNITQSWSISFNASGLYNRHLVRFSLSGLPEASDLRVELDGKDLGWIPKEGLGLDRWHYDIHRDGGLSNGEHELRFTLLNGEREGVAQMCSAEILEFGDESEFISTPGHYSLYPTYSDKNETSYRPTNEDCLMRVVTTPNFCKVCIEGLWLSLLKRVNLIDNFTESCTRAGLPDPWAKSFNLELVPLAQLRQGVEGPINNEAYAIVWEKDGVVLDEFANQTYVTVDDAGSVGVYTVSVKFSTDEVRVDKEGLLKASLRHEVKTRCRDSL